MFLRIFALVAIAGACGVARADEPAAAPQGPPRAVVNCYDSARDLVARVLASECHGKVISDSEAAVIATKHENRLKQALGRREPGFRDGLRMVSLGTGFYTDDDGRLLTNNHVVDGCGELTVRLGDSPDIDPGGDDEIAAQVLAVDAALDLALVKTDSQGSATAEFPAPGSGLSDTSVAIVGYPNQGLPLREPMATPGLMEQRTTFIAGYDHIVLHADLRHGNSGGPIFDRQGRVLGMVNAKIDSAAYFTATGLTLTDIGIGIPARAIVDFLNRNNVTHEESQGGQSFNLRELLDRARPFVVRVECWK